MFNIQIKISVDERLCDNCKDAARKSIFVRGHFRVVGGKKIYVRGYYRKK